MNRYRFYRSGFLLLDVGMAVGLFAICLTILGGSFAIFARNANFDAKAIALEEAQGLMDQLRQNPGAPLPSGWSLRVIETKDRVQVVRLSHGDSISLDGLVPLP